MTETKTALRQELRNLIIRNFGMKYCLKLSEIKELLREIPELGVSEADVLGERKELKQEIQSMENSSVLSGNDDYHFGFEAACKRILAVLGSDSELSAEEERDLEASKKEIAKGKSKRFATADDLIADLHKGRKGKETNK